MSTRASKFALIFALSVSPVFGAFGAYETFTASATQADRPFDRFFIFAKDEICDYARPYVNGSAVSEWQFDEYSRWPASSLCPGGSVKAGYIAFHYSVTNTTTYTIDYRNHTVPCHLATASDCLNAAYDQAGMLALTWDSSMSISPYPASTGTTTRNPDARTMMLAGYWTYRRRGPIMTQVVIEDRSTSRTQDFGWRQKRLARVTGTLQTDWSSFSVAADWSAVARPFKVQVDAEIVSICYAAYNSGTGNSTLYLGTTNGASSACATTSGHGQDGSPVYNHYAEELRTFARLMGDEPMRLAASIPDVYTSTITVNDASSISSPSVLNIAGEFIRVCNKSGNVLTVGTGNWGCAADNAGRSWWGSNAYRYNAPANSPVYNWSTITDAWVDASADRYKSLHPVFVMTFMPGWSSVATEYHLLNTWSDRLQDQMYTVTFYGGAAITSITGVTHKAMTSWKWPDGPLVGTYTTGLGSGLALGKVSERKYWYGDAPAPGKWDQNLAYKRYAGAIPYDPTISIAQSGIDSLVGTLDRSHSEGTYYAWDNSDKAQIPTTSTWSNGTKTQWNCAGEFKKFSATGGRPDIAVFPFWAAAALYAMSSNLSGAERWQEGLFGIAACQGYVPFHVWEGDTSSSRKFCYASDTTYRSCTGANQTVVAFGRPWSIDARPLSSLTFDQANNSDPYNSRLLYQGDQAFNNWIVGDGNAHWPQMNYIPWLLTGDWYYEIGLQDEGAFSLMNSNSTATGRKGSWGWPSWYNMTRTVSWHWRNLIAAAWGQRTGSEFEEYFVDKINKMIEINEGKLNITDGSYYRPCASEGDSTSTPWCYGRKVEGRNWDTSNARPYFGNVASWGWNDWGNVDQRYTYHIGSMWMENFGRASIGWGVSAGYDQLIPFWRRLAKDNINLVLNPGVNPFAIGEYRDPIVPCRPQGVAQVSNCSSQTFNSGEQWLYTDYAALNNSWNSIAKSKRAFDNNSDRQGGYSTISESVLRIMRDDIRDGTMSSTRAQEFITYAAYGRVQTNGSPQWDFSSDSKHRIAVRAYPQGSGDLAFVFSAPDGAACSYNISSANQSNTLDTSDTSIPGGTISRKVVLSGQSAGAKVLRVTCNNARGKATFTQD